MRVRDLIAGDRDAIVWAFGVAIATTLGSAFGDLVTFPETGSAILYAPYAVLAAALFLRPRREWWMFLAASFVGHIVLAFHDAFRASAALIASTEVANQSRAVVAVLAWQRLHRARPRLDTLEEMGSFLGVAGVLGPAVGATIGAAVALLHGRAPASAGGYAAVWSAWFLSNAVVGITLLPLLLVAARVARDARERGTSIFRDTGPTAAEIGLLALGLATAWIALLGGSRGIPVRLFAPIPFLLWAAVRFGTLATTAALLVVSGCAVVGVANGWGPLSATPTDDGVLSLYLYLAFTTLPCLLVAALVEERETVFGAMREGEERMTLAASAANLGFWAWRHDAPLWLSEHATRMLGVDGAVTPNDIAALVHDEDRERLLDAIGPQLARDGVADEEFRIVRRDGEERWISVAGRVQIAPGGSVAHITGVVVDVTVRRAASLELAATRRELSHLGRVATLGQLSGAMAHELRQPLTAILLDARTAQRMLAQEPPDVDAVRVILDDIASGNIRANAVIARLRTLLKRDDEAFEPVALNDIVAQSLNVVGNDLLMRGVIAGRRLAHQLPFVLGDRVELQQVLVNLLINASEAMDGERPSARRLTVSTRYDASGSESGSVIVSVADQGPGIREANLNEVFEPFVTTKADGLGLGLSICQTIVSAHRGKLWAENNADGGATFHVALPAERASGPQLQSLSRKVNSLGGAGGHEYDVEISRDAATR